MLAIFRVPGLSVSALQKAGCHHGTYWVEDCVGDIDKIDVSIDQSDNSFDVR